MLQPQQIEDLICLVSSLDRDSLIRQFQSYQARFPLDFTDHYLSTAPLERLRHIFLAVCLQSQHLPTLVENHAA
jgi:hypothetical protein